MTDTLRTWDTYFCAECCNGDRCDDPTHYDRQKCPHCKGTGLAIWKMRDLMRELSALRQANAEPVAEVLYAGILDAQQRHLQFIVVKEQLPDHMKLYAVPIAKTAAQPAPACGCKRADAWKCAVEQRLSSVSCHCACHKQPAPAAALTPGLERAAEICHDERLTDNTGDPTDIAYLNGIRDCVAAIRAEIERSRVK